MDSGRHDGCPGDWCAGGGHGHASGRGDHGTIGRARLPLSPPQHQRRRWPIPTFPESAGRRADCSRLSMTGDPPRLCSRESARLSRMLNHSEQEPTRGVVSWMNGPRQPATGGGLPPPSVDRGKQGSRAGRKACARPRCAGEPNRDDGVGFFGAACSSSSSTPLEAYPL